MRRAVLTLSGTVAGLAALFSFRTHVPGVSEVATPSTPVGLSSSAPEVSTSAAASSTLKPPTSKPSASGAASASASASKASRTSPATTPSSSAAKTTPASASASSTPTKKASSPASATPTPTPTPTKSTAAAPASYAGPTENTQYGEVQVTITVSGGKITNAVGSLPGGGDSIGANAVSQLDSEVVAAQSANVQAVSGATYTSDGYIASLQSAVDQAGV